MKVHRVEYSLTSLCACLGVSRSGYYAWLYRKPSQRHQHRRLLDQQVNTLFHQHKQRYGAERLQQKLQQEDGKRYDLKTMRPV